MTDLAASIRQRLKNVGGAANFQSTLTHFAMERFLYRLSVSKHSNHFVLKGSLVFHAWGAPTTRSTKDIDFLGIMANSPAAVEAVFRDVCGQTVDPPDGLVFEPETVKATPIKEDADYQGVRVTFIAELAKAEVKMQVDIGFGDVVEPGFRRDEYPSLLDFPRAQLRSYPPEAVVAEKFQAMVALGTYTSRVKDFYDLWVLARDFEFDGNTLCSAVRATFQNRNTEFEREPAALTPEFARNSDKQHQWRNYLRIRRLNGPSDDLGLVIENLRHFLLPVAAALMPDGTPLRWWARGGPWVRYE